MCLNYKLPIFQSLVLTFGSPLVSNSALFYFVVRQLPSVENHCTKLTFYAGLATEKTCRHNRWVKIWPLMTSFVCFVCRSNFIISKRNRGPHDLHRAYLAFTRFSRPIKIEDETTTITTITAASTAMASQEFQQSPSAYLHRHATSHLVTQITRDAGLYFTFNPTESIN